MQNKTVNTIIPLLHETISYTGKFTLCVLERE